MRWTDDTVNGRLRRKTEWLLNKVVKNSEMKRLTINCKIENAFLSEKKVNPNIWVPHMLGLTFFSDRNLEN